jgi:plastocyanin
MKTITNIQFALVLLFLVAINTGLFATKYIINVQEFTFTPNSIATVKIGDTVHWNWINGMHTTTSTTIPAGAASWNQVIDLNNTGFDYIPSVVGVYNYKCTPHESLGMIASFTVITANGITVIPPVSDILIYPNPFVDNITFRITTTDDSWIRDLKVYTTSGKVIREVTLNTRPDFPEKTVNLSELPTGLMFFVFMDNYDRIYTRRVVRQ